MHQTVLVGESQRAGDLDRDLERLADSQVALAHDELFEVLALDVFEDDVLASILLAAVDDGDDVRVLQLCDGAGLSLEPLDEVLVLVVLLVENLERDVALEERVVGPVDARHPAVTDYLLQLVSFRDGLPDHGGKLPALPASHAYERARRSRTPSQRPPHQMT